MPDPTPTSAPSTQSSAVQIASLIINCVQTLVIAVLAFMSNQHSQQLSTVEYRQVQAVEETADVKKDLNKRADTLDRKARETAQATAINLYGSWKYLEMLAAAPGATQKDADKANEAKKLYDEFVARNPRD